MVEPRESAASSGDDNSMALVAMELEHALKQIECLTGEMNWLKENSALDQKHYQTLLAELEEAKSELDQVPALREKLQQAFHTIDEQTDELERLKFELTECGGESAVPSMGRVGEDLARELGGGGECLSLADEMRQLETFNVQQEAVSVTCSSVYGSVKEFRPLFRPMKMTLIMPSRSSS